MTRNNYLIFALLILVHSVSAQSPAPPAGIVATGYDSHIELRWESGGSVGVNTYQIYRSTDGTNFALLKALPATQLAWIDWIGDEGQNQTRYYQLRSIAGPNTGTFSATITAQTQTMSDEQLLDMVQRYTFRYFWDFAHPASGLARERSNGNADIVTTGGSGFGIMSIVIATERGWITRSEAVNRMLQIVSFLQYADRFHGVFPHWMNGLTGDVYPFSQFDNGADLVETAFMMQGLLTARQYFNLNTPYESAMRDVIDGLWEDVEWDWFRKTPTGPVLYWHWSPDYAWQMNFPLRGLAGRLAPTLIRVFISAIKFTAGHSAVVPCFSRTTPIWALIHGAGGITFAITLSATATMR